MYVCVHVHCKELGIVSYVHVNNFSMLLEHAMIKAHLTTDIMYVCVYYYVMYVYYYPALRGRKRG